MHLLARLLLFNALFVATLARASVEVDVDSEELYVLNVNNKKLLDFISKFTVGKSHFIPTKVFLNAIGAYYQDDGKSITGWLFSRDKTFEIIKSENTITYNGNLYFNLSNFCNSLNIDLHDHIEDGTLFLNTSKKFPFEISASLNNNQTKGKRTTKQTDIPHQYNSFNNPNFQLNVNTSNTSGSWDQGTSITYHGDILYATTKVILNHRDKTKLSLVNVSKVIDVDNSRPITSYELGDINTRSIHHLTSNFRGKGIALFKQKENSNPFHNYKTISGFHLPNYRVELYQDGALIDYTTTNELGYYEFINNPLFLGENHFEIRFYGEYGDIKSEKRNYNITGSNLKKGEHNYSFYALDTSKNIGGEQLSDHGIVSNFEYEYGLDDTLSYGFGLTQIENENRRRYVANSLNLTHGKQNFKLEAITNKSNWSLSSRFRGNFYGTNYNFSITKNSDDFKFNNRAQKNLISLALFKRTNWFDSQLDNFSIFSSYKRQQTKRSETSFYRVGFSTRYRSLSLNHNSNFGEDTTQHKTSFKTTIFGWRARLENTYSEMSFKQNLKFSKSVFHGNLSLKVERDHKNNINSYSTSYNKQFDNFSMRAFASKTASNYEFGVNVNTNIFFEERPKFTRNSLQGAGTFRVFAFIDENYNDKYDEGEVPVANLTFSGLHHWRHQKTNKHGIAILPGVPHLSSTAVTVNEESIEDFTLATPKTLFAQVHEGGQIAILTPLKRRKFLEFTLYKATEPTPLKYQKFTLASETQIIEGFTDDEGYFYSENIFPGTFTLTLTDQEQLNATIQIPNDKETTDYYFERVVVN